MNKQRKRTLARFLLAVALVLGILWAADDADRRVHTPPEVTVER